MNFINAYFKYWETMFNIPKHTWATPHKIINSSDVADFLCFSNKDSDTPIIINPPQAGHISSGVDFSKGRSLVETFTKKYNNVYSWDWKDSDYSRKDDDISTMINRMDEDISKLNKPVILVGVCQGGWQSAIYASIFPEKVKKLILVASPIDYHKEGGLNIYTDSLPSEFFKFMVDMGLGCMNGNWIVMGYKMMHVVDRYLKDPLDMFNNILEGKNTKKQEDFISWYDKGTSYLPGKYYLDVIEMFKDNSLIKGELKINGENVDLSNIKCDVLVVTGQKDDITGKDQALAIKECVKTKVKHYEIPKVGHFGSFSGGGSMKYWHNEAFQLI